MAATETRPAKKRGKTTDEAPKAKAKVVKPIKSEDVEEAGSNGTTVDKLKIELEHVNTTTRYEKFSPPEGSGCVGQFYAPPGAKTVKVLIEY